MGADEGDLAEFLEFVESKGWSERIRYEGAVAPSRVREKLAQATVFVLPSVDEPFPMTVLEALSVGTPTVVTDSCHIAADLAERGAVSVSAPPASALADAVLDLLNDPAKRPAMGQAGRQAIEDAYGIGPVVDHLEHIYGVAVERAAAKIPGRPSARAGVGASSLGGRLDQRDPGRRDVRQPGHPAVAPAEDRPLTRRHPLGASISRSRARRVSDGSRHVPVTVLRGHSPTQSLLSSTSMPRRLARIAKS